MPKSSIFAKKKTTSLITPDHPLNIKMNKSSASKKSSEEDDLQRQPSSGITNPNPSRCPWTVPKRSASRDTKSFALRI
jgi:hypothetical protein